MVKMISLMISHKLFLISLLFASPLSSQELTFRGGIEEDEDQPGNYCLDGSDATLTSSTLTLGDFLETDLELRGIWNRSYAKPSVEVTAITPVTANFQVTSSRFIGEPATFSVTGPVGAPAGTFYARGRGFIPFNGTVFQMQLSSVTTVGLGVVGPSGVFEATIDIPNNPALIGLVAYGQGFWFEAGQVKMTNTECFRVEDPNA